MSDCAFVVRFSKFDTTKSHIQDWVYNLTIAFVLRVRLVCSHTTKFHLKAVQPKHLNEVIYIYIYMYIHMCIHIYLSISLYIYIYIQTHIQGSGRARRSDAEVCYFGRETMIYLYIYIYTYIYNVLYTHMYKRSTTSATTPSARRRGPACSARSPRTHTI